MKRFAGWSAVIALVILIIGCGGGGGGSGSGSGGTSGGTYHDFQVTAYGGADQMLDTRNIVVGDVIQLNITARDANENLVILNASAWSINAPSTVATLSSSGVLRAVGSSGNTVYVIKGLYGGVLYKVNLTVSAAQDLVTGIVRNTANPIEDAIVDFYDINGNRLAVAYTARDGTFRGSVPSTATQFTIDMSLADPGNVYYYTQFAYGTQEFLEGTSCLTPLPTPLSATVPTALPNPVVPDLRSVGPPPPPTGCLG